MSKDMKKHAPQEPILAVDDIQGLAVPGFNKPFQTFLGARMPGDAKGIARAKHFLRTFAEEVTSTAQTLEDRRRYRESRRSEGVRRLTTYQGLVGVAIGFTYAGMKKLTPGADSTRRSPPAPGRWSTPSSTPWT